MFSFNYNGGSGLQLSNTDYSMCVRMERNFCGIEYTACADTINPSPQSFSVSGSSNTGSQVARETTVTTVMMTTMATPVLAMTRQ